MKAAANGVTKSAFVKTDVHCLYHYETTGAYYALVKTQGKPVRQGLETTDKATARRGLGDYQRDLGKVDPLQERLTLRELCKRYPATVANCPKKTLGIKTL